MSQAELAQRAARPLKTINEIVQGKAAITPETAIQLEQVLGVPASFWNSRESGYREAVARAEQHKKLGKQVGRLKDVPVRAMEKLGWLEREKDGIRRLEGVLSFFGVASIDALEARGREPRFRKSKAFKANPIAVGAWVRKGHIDAQRVECEPFDEKTFRSVLEQARRLSADAPADVARRLVALCASSGVALVFVQELPGTHLSGAARWLTPTRALIQLSERHRTNDHFWFTFFHEAAHLLKHGRKKIYIDADNGDEGSEEAEANKFAADFLIPPARWSEFLSEGKPSKTAINEFASSVGIAPGIVVGRLQHERKIPFSFHNDLKKRIALPR